VTPLSVEQHDGAGQHPAESWLRANPHRLDLGRIGLWTEPPLAPADLHGIEQVLDLWRGTIRSRFTAGGVTYRVTTAAHPVRDALAVVVEPSTPVRCGLRLRFPYGSEAWGDAADWSSPAAHRSQVQRRGDGWAIRRELDGARYHVAVSDTSFELIELGPHDVAFAGDGTFGAVIEFGPVPCTDPLPAAEVVIEASARHWAAFWEAGGAVELAGSDDSRGVELERRIVLSQYLAAVNGSGPLPPAETGLMLNSWRGRSHLEMHALHSAQFALWGHPELLARQLDWYHTILPLARETAARQRLPGVRWPKQVDPSGLDTPSSIGPFLVWQQPQPILLAELLYRADPTPRTTERWIDLVVATAEFMAAFVSAGEGGFGLGPPIVPAQESYHRTRRTARNPTFELALWSWGLGVAADWCGRAGRQAPPRWREVAGGMARPHTIDGIYAALATPPYLVRDDHPSMLAALGVVPPTDVIDEAVMGCTFDDVWSRWDWASTWGWDYPVAAMCAARLGRPADAVRALFTDSPKNHFLPNGHNRQTAELPIYLPANGALLWAIALMAAGWDGAARPAPGFPDGWKVAVDGVLPLP